MSASSTPLPTTLAQRVRHLRERRLMSPERLAEAAQLPVEYVQDLESGLELFLSPAIRQRLARTLHIRAEQLLEVEKLPKDNESLPRNLQKECLELMERVRRNPEADYSCPVCEASLEIRQFQRRDLDDNPIQAVKAHCTRCLFRLILD